MFPLAPSPRSLEETYLTFYTAFRSTEKHIVQVNIIEVHLDIRDTEVSAIMKRKQM